MNSRLPTIHAAARPIGFLPIRVSPAFARQLRRIHQLEPELAQQIRQQVLAAMDAERQVRRLLARFRILQRRRNAVLSFAQASRAAHPADQRRRRAS